MGFGGTGWEEYNKNKEILEPKNFSDVRVFDMNLLSNKKVLDLLKKSF